MDALGVELKLRRGTPADGAGNALSGTRVPTDELLLTYHTIDAGGGETRPSYFVNTVRELLPDVRFPLTGRRPCVTACRRNDRRSNSRARIFRATGQRRAGCL